MRKFEQKEIDILYEAADLFEQIWQKMDKALARFEYGEEKDHYHEFFEIKDQLTALEMPLRGLIEKFS